VRIISGTHKGRRISPDKKFKARPTTDFAKENLFNVLNNIIDFEGLDVLDLFGGTGGISYEFASRGANSVVCVELEYKHLSFIKKTINELEFKNITALRSDVFRYLKSGSKKYDLIFADPPYDLERIEEIPGFVFAKKLLSDDGLLVVEHPARLDFSQHECFKFSRVYGSVNFSFFEHI